MLSSIVLLSTLAVSALGSNSSAPYTFPAGFNLGLVKPDELSTLSTIHGLFQSQMTDHVLQNRLLVPGTA